MQPNIVLMVLAVLRPIPSWPLRFSATAFLYRYGKLKDLCLSDVFLYHRILYFSWLLSKDIYALYD